MNVAAAGRRYGAWTAALVLAVLIHLLGLSLLQVDRPRGPEPGFDGLLVSLGNTGTAPMDHRPQLSDDPQEPMADQGQEEAPPDLPQGDGVLREAPAQAAPPATPSEATPPAPAPANPLAAAQPQRKPQPPTPVAESPPEQPMEAPPAPRPNEAPLAESRTFTPQQTSPPMGALPEALVPDRLNDLNQARPDVAPREPSTMAPRAHASPRLGAIGGGPVWRHGEPPANAGRVPEGSDYWNLVYKALHDAGRYPPQAAPLGLEGVAIVEFAIDRTGAILTYRKLKSAGHIILDHEVNRMMEWADIPPPPASIPDEALLVTVHVNFEILRLADQGRAAR